MRRSAGFALRCAVVLIVVTIVWFVLSSTAPKYSPYLSSLSPIADAPVRRLNAAESRRRSARPQKVVTYRRILGGGPARQTVILGRRKQALSSRDSSRSE